MVFRQAFYTRETGTGLKIVASSDKSIEFENNCLSVGSKFETETSDETAEFVYYSDSFDRYVGVGVSPASYTEHAGKNKLVHIWVPENSSSDPSDYYLSYAFDRNVDKNSDYGNKEFLPSLKREDYITILQKYALDVDKIAELLYKITPIAFREKNFLAVYLSENEYKHEELSVIAREITWLMSMLIPAVGEDRIKCRQNLSYSVLSKSNINIINIAYVTDTTDLDNCFNLKEKDSAQVPEIYRQLAKKAVESIDVYEEFLEDLYNCRLEERLSTENFKLMFLNWKIKYEHVSLNKKDIPVSWEKLIQRGQRNVKYRYFLYEVSQCIEDLSERDLAELHAYIFKNDQKAFVQDKYDEFISSYVNAIQKAFFTENAKLYRIYLSIENEALKERIFNDLWENKNSENCISLDIMRTENASDFIERLKLYQCLERNPAFISQMHDIVINKKYYFQMDLEDRAYVSALFGVNARENDTSWKDMLQEQIISFFRTDETYISFIEQEIGRIEENYVPFYFSYFLDNCQKAEDNTLRKQLQKIAYRFLEEYKNAVDSDDLKTFELLDLVWYQNDFQNRIENLSFEELTAFKDFGNYIQKYPVEACTDWYNAIISRMALEKPSDMIIENLVFGIPYAARISEGKKLEYMDAIWNYCGDHFDWRMYCSVKMDCVRYNIWSYIDLCDISKFETITSYVERPNSGYILLINQRLSNLDSLNAEFNRCCYLLWRQVRMGQNCDWSRFSAFDLNGYAEEFGPFLEKLQEELSKRSSWMDCLNYLAIDVKKAELLFKDKPETISDRWNSYRRLKELHEDFFYIILGLSNNQKDKEISRRLTEMKLYNRLDNRNAVDEDNLDEMAALLYDSEELGLDSTIDLFESLDEEYEKVMGNLSNEQNELQASINHHVNKRNEIEEQLGQLQKMLKELNATIEKEIKIRDKMKQKRDNAKKARKGKKADKHEMKITRDNIPGMKETPLPLPEQAQPREEDLLQGVPDRRNSLSEKSNITLTGNSSDY